MTFPAYGTPGQAPQQPQGPPSQQQQGWTQLPMPTPEQMRAATQPQPPQPQQPQQPQYAPQPTQFIHSTEPSMQAPAPDLRYQPPAPPPQAPQPPSQQQPYLVQPQQPQHPQQPQGQQPGPAGLPVDSNGRIMAAQGVPPELVGRTTADMFQLYNLIRNAYVESQLAQTPQPTAQPPQQQPPQTPTPTSQQVPARAKPTDFWSDPIGTMERIIDSRLGPVIQKSNLQGIKEARDTVAAAIPEFVQYETAVVEALRGQPPEILSNPEAWRKVFFYVKSEQDYRNRQSGQQPPQAGNGFQRLPVPPQPQGWQPPVGSFFTESPTPPQPDQNQAGQLTPEELIVAQKFGLSPQAYLNAKMGRF